MKKVIALSLIISMCLPVLAGCGESDQTNDENSNENVEDVLYVDYEIGDMIYDNGSVSFYISALTENESGGYSMTVLVTNDYSGDNYIFSLVPYDTDEYDEYIKEIQNGETATISPTAEGVTFYVESDEEDSELSGDFDWDAKYVYYGVLIFVTSEEVTENNVQEILDSSETEEVLDTVIKIDTSGVTLTTEESTTDSDEDVDVEKNEDSANDEPENNTESTATEAENIAMEKIMERFKSAYSNEPTITGPTVDNDFLLYNVISEGSEFVIAYHQTNEEYSSIAVGVVSMDETTGASSWMMVCSYLAYAVDKDMSKTDCVGVFTSVYNNGDMDGTLDKNGIHYSIEGDNHYFTISIPNSLLPT